MSESSDKFFLLNECEPFAIKNLLFRQISNGLNLAPLLIFFTSQLFFFLSILKCKENVAFTLSFIDNTIKRSSKQENKPNYHCLLLNFVLMNLDVLVYLQLYEIESDKKNFLVI